MKKNKKADLSINIIIIAAIALLVLVVLIAIFTGRMNIFSKESQNCESIGGKCTDESNPNCGEDDLQNYPVEYRAAKCETGGVCCTVGEKT